MSSSVLPEIKAAWKRVLESQKKFYDSSVDYDLYLEKSREEFQKRWLNVQPSPQTGLMGYRVIGTLGSGSFGCVQLVQNESTGEFHAAKVLSKHKVVIRHQIRNAFCEKRVLQSINFPNHTSLEFSSKDNDYLYLGMTLVRGGELFVYLRKVKRFSETHAIFYAAQMFLALEYLHSLQLVYRDLKPENICIDLNGYLKLTDYGFTKYVSSRTSTLCGTPEYLAPEILNTQPYSNSVDWWAFGIFVYELVAGHTPFASHVKDHLSMYAKICDGKYKIPKDFSNALRHLVSRLLQTQPSKRLGVCKEGRNDIRNHAWFSKVDWYGLLNQLVLPPYIPAAIELNDLIREQKLLQPKSNVDQYEEIFKEF